MTKTTSILSLIILSFVSLAPAGSVLRESKPKEGQNQDAKQTDGDKVPQAKPDPPAWGGLTVYRLGTEVSKASHVVILMHGLGGTGKDLVPLGQVLTVSDSTCIIFPEAPNGLPRGGRAWVRQSADIQNSRDKVVALLTYIKQKNPKAEVVLGGFSQGATLASMFLEKDSQLVNALILLSPSGHLPAELTGAAKDKPLVFLAHGRNDAVLPFKGSDTLQKKLVEHEFEVDWLPFEGGHTIPQNVAIGINQFLVRLQGHEVANDK